MGETDFLGERVEIVNIRAPGGGAYEYSLPVQFLTTPTVIVSGQNPATQILTARLSITTSATPGTLVSSAVLAAPGAGLSYRIFGYGARVFPNGAGNYGAIIQLDPNDNTSFLPGFGLAYDTMPSVWLPMTDRGWKAAVNSPFNIEHMANMASVTLRAFVMYVIE